MKKNHLKMVSLCLTSALIACYAVGLKAQPPLATGADAEVSEDGLHRVDRAVMDGAWVRPDLDLSRYTKIYFLPTGVLFREVNDTMARTGSRVERTEFPVDAERVSEFRLLFRNTFLEELDQVARFELTTTPGRDVLIAQGFLIDVVSHVPPISAGDVSTTVRTTWEATMVLELRDSMSHDMLARTVERERPEGAVNTDDLWRETRFLITRWSQILCTRLEELSEISVL